MEDISKKTKKGHRPSCEEIRTWLEDVYGPWYLKATSPQTQDDSNPAGDPPPKPPGFQP